MMITDVGVIDLSNLTGWGYSDERPYGAMIDGAGRDMAIHQDELLVWLEDNCSSWLPYRDNGHPRWLSIISTGKETRIIAHPLNLADASLFFLRWG